MCFKKADIKYILLCGNFVGTDNHYFIFFLVRRSVYSNKFSNPLIAKTNGNIKLQSTGWHKMRYNSVLGKNAISHESRTLIWNCWALHYRELYSYISIKGLCLSWYYSHSFYKMMIQNVWKLYAVWLYKNVFILIWSLECYYL